MVNLGKGAECIRVPLALLPLSVCSSAPLPSLAQMSADTNYQLLMPVAVVTVVRLS
jgi:hypothetical protein